eukprot:11698949-Alexandrium_andersonii.AAC.1
MIGGGSFTADGRPCGGEIFVRGVRRTLALVYIVVRGVGGAGAEVTLVHGMAGLHWRMSGWLEGGRRLACMAGDR